MANHRLFRSITPFQPIPTGLTPSGGLKNKAKCLLFDVYGTLFISASGDIGTTQYQEGQPRLMDILFDKYHIHKNPELMINGLLSSIEAEHVRLKAMGVDFPEVNIAEVWHHLLVGMPAETVRQFAEEFEHIVNPVCPMPHLKTILSRCRLKASRWGSFQTLSFILPSFLNNFWDEISKALDSIRISSFFHTVLGMPSLPRCYLSRQKKG